MGWGRAFRHGRRGLSWTKDGAGGQPTWRRWQSHLAAGSTWWFTTSWASTKVTGSSTWLVAAAWRSSWHMCAGRFCSGIDASQRLVAVARDRNASADIRVGDLHALPWGDAILDVVTSFRGVWGTTADVVGEIRRVLVPGGRVGLTVWGHLKASPGFWAMAPFALAAAPEVENQAAMLALGRPGAGEELLARHGFVDIERIDVPFVAEFADPDIYARAMASTGPGYEAIQNVGEAAFADAATNEAIAHIRDGLPLRAEIALVGYLARTPGPLKRDEGDIP